MSTFMNGNIGWQLLVRLFFCLEGMSLSFFPDKIYAKQFLVYGDFFPDRIYAKQFLVNGDICSITDFYISGVFLQHFLLHI